MKRFLDILITLLLMPLISLLCLITALLVKIKLGSPVFFTQSRPGLHKSIFHMVKFRTMTNERDPNGHLLSDNDRLTQFGKFLRSTSLDELPGLWSVIKGDMSLVGPRPLLIEYLPLYSTHQLRRQDVLPGITGWAQINGRNAISWDEKFNLDIWYVDNHSTWLDIKILFLTAKKIIKRDGINQDGHATSDFFKGNSGET